jgi:chorismatase
MNQTQLVRNTENLGYLPNSSFVNLDETAKFTTGHNVLGQINYATEAIDPQVSSGHPVLSVQMTDSTLDGFAEFWTTPRPVESGEHDGICYAHDGEYFLCAGRIPQAQEYAKATESAYVTALDLITTLDYTNCFRMWNFVNQINDANSDGLEIYRDFCLGRANAFERFKFNETEVPAATGIGSLGGGIAFYFLTCRSSVPTTIENPQQMSAYHYPKRYGPKSPKFARATHLMPANTLGQAGHVYVSGTASITGHETRFHRDIEKQTHLALENIGRVVNAANLSAYELANGYDLSDLNNVKVYVRHRDDIPQVREICEQALSPTADVRYLNVDICRSDLLVEIEGIVN